MNDELLRLAYIAGAAGVVLELFAAFNRSKKVRTLLYGIVFVAVLLSASLLFVFDPGPVMVVVAFIALYRLFNALRVIKRRIAEPRLYFSSRRTSLALLAFQAVSLVLWRLQYHHEPRLRNVMIVLLGLSGVVAVVLLVSLRRNLARMKVRPSDVYRADAELPSVSVCIPARNETADLPGCLSSLLKSDYPKLEILVLDDCSHDATSEIIKGFAQKGVRFISGDPPKDGWLAKNQAYQALAEAASGEILLFCGVDTRFEKTAIRSMVGSLHARKKQMISLLPKGLQSREHANLLQPMRYWWELALPRRLFNRPPVLSTVWMITRQAFFGRGEMKAVKASVIPEGYFARELTLVDEYSFMRANGKMMISSAKRLPDQWQTALRVRYPRLRKRPENILLVTCIEAWLFLLPLGILLSGFLIGFGVLQIIAGAILVTLVWTHYLLMRAWLDRVPLLSVVLFPVAVLMDLYLMQLSMFKYEFSTVNWKDRNICIPVMRYERRLPKLEEE